jgi:hypothetical protein
MSVSIRMTVGGHAFEFGDGVGDGDLETTVEAQVLRAASAILRDGAQRFAEEDGPHDPRVADADQAAKAITRVLSEWFAVP